MNLKYLDKTDLKGIEEIFTSAFTDSEGEEEGRLIGKLSIKLASEIDNQDIFCFGAFENEDLAGCIFFSRLFFKKDISMYILAPVAVSTKHQRKGIGKSLIDFGLDELRKKAVDVAITYGDPAYYSRVGFEKLSETKIQAPYRLSQPHGWLGQTLNSQPIPVIQERPVCVEAFNDPVYW